MRHSARTQNGLAIALIAVNGGQLYQPGAGWPGPKQLEEIQRSMRRDPRRGERERLSYECTSTNLDGPYVHDRHEPERFRRSAFAG
jgi:hypothetical protein